MSTSKPKLQTLQLPLTPNLFLHLAKTIQSLAMGPNNDTQTIICQVKEEVVEFAGYSVFKETIIQLTPEEFNCLRENLESVTSLPDCSSHYLKNIVQQSFLRID